MDQAKICGTIKSFGFKMLCHGARPDGQALARGNFMGKKRL